MIGNPRWKKNSKISDEFLKPLSILFDVWYNGSKLINKQGAAENSTDKFKCTIERLNDISHQEHGKSSIKYGIANHV